MQSRWEGLAFSPGGRGYHSVQVGGASIQSRWEGLAFSPGGRRYHSVQVGGAHFKHLIQVLHAWLLCKCSTCSKSE